MSESHKNSRIISRKGELRPILECCLRHPDSIELDGLLKQIHDQILFHRVKFPLLEFVALELYDFLPKESHFKFCDKLEALKTEGGNVILGKLLQHHLSSDFDGAIEHARTYISKADVWYVCDIIGERVWGIAMLNHWEKMVIRLDDLSNDDSRWVTRSFGAGAHCAIRKGLPLNRVELVFQKLLSQAKSKDKEIRQGIGWAAKTTAKFHPEIIKSYDATISANADSWFKRKIQIGLDRHAYNQRNKGQDSSQ